MTTELARCIAGSSWLEVAETVGDEAVRGIVNWLGVALAASTQTAPGGPTRADAGAPPTHRATVLGLGERAGLLSVAGRTAERAAALDYVDTLVPTGLAPSVVVAGTLLPLAEHRAAPGTSFLHAYLLGLEVAGRAALTGAADGVACCAMGAAAGCARLLGLDAARTARCLDATAGFEGHAGEAARHALRSALQAAADAAEHAHRTVRVPRVAAVSLEGWGRDWQIARLGYHAHPCALFLHPVVEACVGLRQTHHLAARRIGAVRVELGPATAALDRGPARDVRCSVVHAAAATLLGARADLDPFQDARRRSPRVRDLAARVDVATDGALPETAARVSVTLTDGGTLQRLVRCALGHPLRPLSDRDLSDKFRRLAAGGLATDQAERLLGLAWNLRALPDVGSLIRCSVPEEILGTDELPGSPLLRR